MDAEDVERGLLSDGYPALSDWIAADPDNEGFMFRKFDRVSSRNILALQCEMLELEARLNRFDDEAYRGDDVDLIVSLREWETFVRNAQDCNRPEHERMKLLKEIRAKVKEYRTTNPVQRW